ncbi:MAG TPA: ATPase, T2SS/T4P/T4SS family [Pirellulaceae bacterium]|nr:ATPase, T2SS/T4P/T4SS family [Pirellulaceae bacterium]
MKIWFNKVHESHRAMVEVAAGPISIGRDADNTIVLNSPLVSRRHALIEFQNGKLQLANVGLNSCMVGEREVFGGQAVAFDTRDKVRIWPYSLTFEIETVHELTRDEVDAHLLGVMADLELRIHKQLLERLDLFELESNRMSPRERILLLENNIDDVCRELNVFGSQNESLLEELAGLALRDLLLHQLIMEPGNDDTLTPANFSSNELDVPATLVPERETELASLLAFLRKRLELTSIVDVTARVQCVEERFSEFFPLIRPHLHGELRKYVILRTLKKALKDTVFGFGPLQDLLRAPTVTEIMVIASDQIYVERGGIIERSGRRFISEEVTEAIVERIVAQVGRRIDKSQPLVDARLPDGSRVNAIIPPLAVKGPCLTVRKFPAQRFTMENMIDMESITEQAALFLRACVIDSRNILISGGTGTGKTTFLNVLSSFVPQKQRIITIEDTTELRLHQEHVVTLEGRPANVEGSGAYTIRDLLKNALRMRPDRIIVGECRGAEALDMLQAMNTGHDGSMTTIHANSAKEVVERLEVLVLMAADLPIISIHRQMESALDIIVHISRLPGGRRVVTQISEVFGIDVDSHEVMIRDIFNYRDGKSLQPTGYLPTFVDELVHKHLLDIEFLFARQTSSVRSVPIAPGRLPPTAPPSLPGGKERRDGR